jgi:hypothetical protein
MKRDYIIPFFTSLDSNWKDVGVWNPRGMGVLIGCLVMHYLFGCLPPAWTLSMHYDVWPVPSRGFLTVSGQLYETGILD